MGIPQTIFITGITGKQGGALAEQLLRKDVKLIGLTRNARSDKAKRLHEQGVTIVEGNMDDADTYREALSKADAVFMVQAFEQGHDSEIKQGKAFVQELVKGGIGYMVYSSVTGADLSTGIPHFESKHIIENHIKESGLNYTFLRPVSFYENFLHPSVDGRIRKGKLVMPLKKDVVMQLIGTNDIGIVAAGVLLNPEKYLGKTLTIATDEMNMEAMADLFSKAMHRPVIYSKLPGLLTRIFMGRDLYKMFQYMNNNDFREAKDIPALKQEFPGLSSLESWIHEHYKPQQ